MCMQCSEPERVVMWSCIGLMDMVVSPHAA